MLQKRIGTANSSSWGGGPFCAGKMNSGSKNMVIYSMWGLFLGTNSLFENFAWCVWYKPLLFYLHFGPILVVWPILLRMNGIQKLGPKSLFLWRWIQARKTSRNEAQNCLFCRIVVCQSSPKTNVFGDFTLETAGDKSEENTAIHDTFLRLGRRNTAKTSVWSSLPKNRVNSGVLGDFPDGCCKNQCRYPVFFLVKG